MDIKAHIKFGIAFAIAVLPFIPAGITGLTENSDANSILTFCGIYLLGNIIGALLPDIDNDKDGIGVLVPHVAKLIQKLVKRATITHDILIALPLGIVLMTVNPKFIGFAVGYIGHLLLDACTNDGIMWGYFFNKSHVRTGVLYGSNKSEHWIDWNEYRYAFGLKSGIIHLMPHILRTDNTEINNFYATILSVAVIIGCKFLAKLLGVVYWGSVF